MTVQKVDTPTCVVDHIRSLYRAKRSFRRIAREDYDGRVSLGVLSRLTKGIEPRRLSIRLALGLPPLGNVQMGPGVAIAFGAILMVSSSICPCGRSFIPNHPSRTHCPTCRPPRKRERRLK